MCIRDSKRWSLHSFKSRRSFTFWERRRRYLLWSAHKLCSGYSWNRPGSSNFGRESPAKNSSRYTNSQNFPTEKPGHCTIKKQPKRGFACTGCDRNSDKTICTPKGLAERIWWLLRSGKQSNSGKLCRIHQKSIFLISSLMTEALTICQFSSISFQFYSSSLISSLFCKYMN